MVKSPTYFSFPILVFPTDIDDGGWTHVRHLPPGNVWFQATDKLLGTAKYGTPCGVKCPQEWSIRFDNQDFNQFLFATGDGTKWLIAEKDEVIGGYYTNGLRTIEKSSSNNNSYQARWYRRSSHKEDPWISLTDHNTAISQGDILYAGQSTHYHTQFIETQGGANVFIRRSK